VRVDHAWKKKEIHMAKERQFLHGDFEHHERVGSWERAPTMIAMEI